MALPLLWRGYSSLDKGVSSASLKQGGWLLPVSTRWIFINFIHVYFWLSFVRARCSGVAPDVTAGVSSGASVCPVVPVWVQRFQSVPNGAKQNVIYALYRVLSGSSQILQAIQPFEEQGLRGAQRPGIVAPLTRGRQFHEPGISP